MEGGGAERVLSNILPNLSKKYNVYLLLLKNKQFYDLPKNIKIISFSKIQHNFLFIPLFPLYAFKLLKLKKKLKPYKIISFLEISNFLNILTNKEAIISFRISLDFFTGSLIKKTYLLLIKKLYPKAQKIIVNSEENRVSLINKLNLKENQVKTIYNPIKKPDNIEKKDFSMLPFSKQKTNKIFITVGRLHEQKNLFTLINAFKTLDEENILIILGDGPQKEELEKHIKTLNLSKQVFLLGQKKDIFIYLNLADYFVFSSRTEGFPNVLIEAMLCNLPIITSDFKTGAREVIDSELKFSDKIKYPYYGTNGVLLSLDNFVKDFQKVEFNKLHKTRNSLHKFELDNIIKEWEEIIK